MLAPAARAGEVFAASSFELPAPGKRIRSIVSLTARCKPTDGEVNTLADTASDSVIEGISGGSTKGEVDNRGLARGHSVVHGDVDSADNGTIGATSIVRDHFNCKDRGACGWSKFTRKVVRHSCWG